MPERIVKEVVRIPSAEVLRRLRAMTPAQHFAAGMRCGKTGMTTDFYLCGLFGIDYVVNLVSVPVDEGVTDHE